MVLSEAGHNVLLIRQDTDALRGLPYGVEPALAVAFDPGFDPQPQTRRLSRTLCVWTTGLQHE